MRSEHSDSGMKPRNIAAFLFGKALRDLRPVRNLGRLADPAVFQHGGNYKPFSGDSNSRPYPFPANCKCQRSRKLDQYAPSDGRTKHKVRTPSAPAVFSAQRANPSAKESCTCRGDFIPAVIVSIQAATASAPAECGCDSSPPPKTPRNFPSISVPKMQEFRLRRPQKRLRIMRRPPALRASRASAAACAKSVEDSAVAGCGALFPRIWLQPKRSRIFFSTQSSSPVFAASARHFSTSSEFTEPDGGPAISSSGKIALRMQTSNIRSNPNCVSVSVPGASPGRKTSFLLVALAPIQKCPRQRGCGRISRETVARAQTSGAKWNPGFFRTTFPLPWR